MIDNTENHWSNFTRIKQLSATLHFNIHSVSNHRIRWWNSDTYQQFSGL